MSSFEDADVSGDPITGPIRALHSTPSTPPVPIDTSFTAAEPDTPNWQQLLNTPAAKELGLHRRSKPFARHRRRKTLNNLSRGSVPASTSEPIEVSFADRINRHGRGAKCIAVMSLKGGVGKTT